MTRPQRSTTTGLTSTGELPPDARGRRYTGNRPDDTTAVLPETPARTAVPAGTEPDRANLGPGAGKRHRGGGNSSGHGPRDDAPYPDDVRTSAATRNTDDPFADDFDVYPEATSRPAGRSHHDRRGEGPHDDRRPRERSATDAVGTFPETSRSRAMNGATMNAATASGAAGASARPGSPTSPGVIGSHGSTSAPDAARLGQPVISRVGEMPDSVRASAGLPLAASASPAAGASAAGRPGGAAVADREVDYRSDGRPEHRSAGALVSDVANNMSQLVRQEIELAKAEMRQSATRAGKGAGMFGGAAVVGVFALLFLLLAVMFGLGEVMALGWAALIVGVILLVCAGILALVGRANVKKVSPKPTQTVETLKEDMQWAHGLRK